MPDLTALNSLEEQGRRSEKPAIIQLQDAKNQLFRRTLCEGAGAALAIGIALLAGEYMPPLLVTSHLAFCAFFLVVCVVALRCPKAVSYSAGLLAAGSYSLLLHQKPLPRVGTVFVITDLLLEPFLLLVCAVLVSDLLSAQRHQFSRAQEQLLLAREKLVATQQSYQAALIVNEELERQIAGQTLTVTTVSEQVECIRRLHGGERYNAIVHLVAHALEASSCALYMRYDGQWYLYAGTGSSPYTEHTPVLKLTNALNRRVLESGQVRTVRDLLPEEVAMERDMPLMAGPLLDDNNQVIGIIVIESLPLLRFTSGTVRLFSAILQLASIALRTPLLQQEIGRDAFHRRALSRARDADDLYQLQEVV